MPGRALVSLSSYDGEKTQSSGYDSYSRINKKTSPGGVVTTYTYDKTNKNTRIAASLGPDICMKYDKYGNMLSTSMYDPDAASVLELKKSQEYTEDGNFETSITDDRNVRVEYVYDQTTGNMVSKRMPIV